MNTALGIFGALGGFVAFGAAVLAIVRAIARQVSATKDNTDALKELSLQLNNLDGRIDDHETRISRLEGRREP